MYLILKSIHATTAILSIAGFIIRGVWMMRSSPLLNERWVKIAPHINDAFLLATAITLVIMTSQYPGSTTWINAKIIGLVLYIVLGTIALKRGKTKSIRIAAWVMAIVMFAYIVSVALSKNILINI